jgi:DNA primase catalytic subunit
MRIAVECIDRRLRADFGFEHILWVFSGSKVACIV